jgi:hypothetical protein
MNSALVKAALDQAMQIDGAIGVALVDTNSGMALGTAGGGSALNMDVAAAGGTEVVKSKLKVMTQLGIRDRIEDILITLGSQFHLIRTVGGQANLFLYLALNRAHSNLAMARHQLSTVEAKLT